LRGDLIGRGEIPDRAVISSEAIPDNQEIGLIERLATWKSKPTLGRVGHPGTASFGLSNLAESIAGNTIAGKADT